MARESAAPSAMPPRLRCSRLSAFRRPTRKTSRAACKPRRIRPAPTQPADARCFVPDWLINGRVWGITCQLYSLRSARNQGIGDFEDLALLAEQAAAAGADFIGVNPLHALFLADPSRCSPYSPSSRRFLNPLYIAVDRLPEAAAGLDPARIEALRDAELVDYVDVARLKRGALERAYRAFLSGGQEEVKRLRGILRCPRQRAPELCAL